MNVLVVEDDADLTRTIVRKLETEGYSVEHTSRSEPVLDKLAAGAADWDVVILDIALPGIDGIELLKEFRRADSLSSVVMLTADNSATTATTCMRAGAFYYLTKPFRPVELVSIVRSAARHAQLRRELAEKQAPASEDDSPLIGGSAAMRKLSTLLGRLANQDVTILIHGESGTGKELVARALHGRSRRRTHPFVALNCGAIPESLIDSELFGHAKGAFTGAIERPGMFVEATRGTLFLDEIGDMPLPVQARLLRVLQEGEVRPLGGTGTRAVDVRVIAATHVDLEAAVEQGRFRQDLFYRLNTVLVRVPALRDRRDDIPLLAAHFLRKHGGATPPPLSPEALDAMMTYDWPGNVRELENALVQAMALHHGDTIDVDHLAFHTAPRAKGSQRIGKLSADTALPLMEAKRQVTAAWEYEYLTAVLQKAGGSIAEAARLAGLDRANFRRMLLRHNIDPSQFK